jgi:hypothetical protein
MRFLCRVFREGRFGVAMALVVLILSAAERAAADESKRLELGFTERFRLLAWDNAITLDDTLDGAQAFTRHRTCLSLHARPVTDLGLVLKLTNEFRYYFTPQDREFTLHELFVDQLYIKWHSRRFARGTITLGRQNIILGEGFVVMDGHPLDGSRAIYFNAVRADLDLPGENSLTGFVSWVPTVDDILPILHDQEMRLLEQDEMGAGLYAQWHLPPLDLHTYWIHKDVRRAGVATVASHINCLGARAVYPFGKQVTAQLEAAYQFGDCDDSDRSAFGGHAYLRMEPERFQPLPWSADLGGIYFSGDDPHTADYEGWDPMFARWPKWSESYIYTQIKEEAVAWWTNLASVYGTVTIDATPSAQIRLDYHHLMAPQRPDSAAAFPGGSGTTRGDLFIAKLTYAFDRHWSGHLLWEGLLPGDFYFDGADPYCWVRTELMFRL